MMPGTHSEEYWTAYGDETNFAGGNGGAAYAKTAPTAATDLTGFDIPYDEEHPTPQVQYNKLATETAGQHPAHRRAFNQYKTVMGGTMKMYVQTSTWLEKAIANLGTNGQQECGLTGNTSTTETGLSTTTQYYFKVTVDGGTQVEYDITTGSATTYNAVIRLINAALPSGVQCVLVGGDLRFLSGTYGTSSAIALAAGTTGTDLFATLTGFTSFDSAVAGTATGVGAVPKASWFTVKKNGNRLYNTYGNYVRTYGLALAMGDGSVSQTIEHETYDVESSAYADAKVDWLSENSTVVQTWDDFSLEVDGYEAELHGLNLSIENEWILQDDKAAGSGEHKYPYFSKFNLNSIEITQRNYDAALFQEDESAAVTLRPIVIDLGVKKLIITELKLVKDSLNERTIPAKGIKTYTYTLELGGRSAIQVV